MFLKSRTLFGNEVFISLKKYLFKELFLILSPVTTIFWIHLDPTGCILSDMEKDF